MAATFQALQRLSLEWHPYQIAGGRSDISILARSGFDFETSKKVLEIEKDDYLRIINLL